MAQKVGKLFKVKKRVQGVVPSTQNSEYFEPVSLGAGIGGGADQSTVVNVYNAETQYKTNDYVMAEKGDLAKFYKVKRDISGTPPSNTTDGNYKLLKTEEEKEIPNPLVLQPRNLVDVLGASSVKDAFARLRAISNTGDFSKLRLGDYIDLVNGLNDGEANYNWNPIEENLRCQIVAFDHYYDANSIYDTETKQHHVVMQFKNCYRKKRMHDTKTNNGGYKNKELQLFLNGSFKNGLVNAIGIKPIKIVRYLDTYNSWEGLHEEVFLPTEVEVIGHQAWGHSWNNARSGYQTGSSMQYPIFSIAPQSRIKQFEMENRSWWVASLCYAFEGNFILVDTSGLINYRTPLYETGGVAPCFCI